MAEVEVVGAVRADQATRQVERQRGLSEEDHPPVAVENAAGRGAHGSTDTTARR
jgi:hypothetical protein